MMYDKLEQDIDYVAQEIVQMVDILIPNTQDCLYKRLVQAMRYAMLTGGKRLRPFLTYMSAKIFKVSSDCAFRAAFAVELIHNYSLVHDDLPDFDNDLIRRGLPTTHAKFDPATAILAGNALFAYAFEILSHSDTHVDNNIRCELIYTLSSLSGLHGLLGGQAIDLSKNTLNITEITRMQKMKTGALFSASCELGAILGKASKHQRMALKGYAGDIGLAFQIVDDILDHVGEKNIVGKQVRKDSAAGKSTYVSLLGLKEAQTQAHYLVEKAQQHLNIFDERADPLRALAQFIISRTH